MADIIFLDLSKAFNKVWYEGFVKKINQIGYLLAMDQLGEFYLQVRIKQNL